VVHRNARSRPNTKISCEGRAILALADFVSFILLFDGGLTLRFWL
jgi:hypothetical protein